MYVGRFLVITHFRDILNPFPEGFGQEIVFGGTGNKLVNLFQGVGDEIIRTWHSGIPAFFFISEKTLKNIRNLIHQRQIGFDIIFVVEIIF